MDAEYDQIIREKLLNRAYDELAIKVCPNEMWEEILPMLHIIASTTSSSNNNNRDTNTKNNSVDNDANNNKTH